MDIEKLAISIVENTISKTNYMVPRFNREDKGVSWDGFIDIYKRAGNVHKKKDFFINIPVQIKGHIDNNLSKQNISYPVEVTDMQNYLNAGGTIYFVVYFDEAGNKSKIYYKSFLPFDVKKILRQSQTQQKKNIIFKRFPTNIIEITNLLHNIANDIHLQKPAIMCEEISFEELIKNNDMQTLSFHISCIPETPYQQITDYIVGKEMYVYANLPFGLKLPIQHIEEIEEVRQTIEKTISIKGKIWYKSFIQVHLRKSTEIHINKSLKIVAASDDNSYELKILIQGNLSERLRDVDFIIQMILAKQIEIGPYVFDLTDRFDNKVSDILTNCQKIYKTLNDIKYTLNKLGIKDELDCDLLNKKDMSNLQILVDTVINEKAVSLEDIKYILVNMTICNLTFVICAIEEKKGSKLYRIYNFNTAPLNLEIAGNDGIRFPATTYLLLDKDTIKRSCNIDYQNMLLQIKKLQLSEVISTGCCNLLLNMLSAYDEGKPNDKVFFESIKELAFWLKYNDKHSEKSIRELNYLQVVKRERLFTKDEIKILSNIIKTSLYSYEILVGAYLLLDNQALAEVYFDKMDDESKDRFCTYPIYHFWHDKANLLP